MRMKVEFFQDETGLIQFYNATDIWIRCPESHPTINPDNLKAQQEKGPRKLLLLPSKQNFQAEKLKLNKLGDLLSDVIDELIAVKTSDNSSLFTVMTERHQLLNQQLQALNSSADRTQNILSTIDKELQTDVDKIVMEHQR